MCPSALQNCPLLDCCHSCDKCFLVSTIVCERYSDLCDCSLTVRMCMRACVRSHARMCACVHVTCARTCVRSRVRACWQACARVSARPCTPPPTPFPKKDGLLTFSPLLVVCPLACLLFALHARYEMQTLRIGMCIHAPYIYMF